MSLKKTRRDFPLLDNNYFLHYPVIVAIRRPKQLIGYSANIEFANFRFRVDVSDVSEEKFVNDFEVKFQAHNQPLTLKMAARISGIEPVLKIKMLFGCGALGSKIGLHFGRSGNHLLVFADPDSLSSHNMARHALLAGNVGINKARALTDEIKAMFPPGKATVVVGTTFPDFDAKDNFESCAWLFDFTASAAFFNRLVNAKNLAHMGVASSSISDFGNLGITLIEGEARNPRIDDLQASLYALHETDPKISDWLRRETATSEKENINVTVGVGCNSETTILSDVKVSSHAAFAAGVLERHMSSRKKTGSMFMHRVSETPNYGIETSMYDVAPFDVFDAVNDPTWSVRFRSGIVDQMRATMTKAKKKETGGIFIGVANHKTKTIHITGLIAAPPDSKGNAACFYRGIKGLPAAIEKITKASGMQLGYIGEWHSHPHGPDGLSTIDLANVGRFKAEFEALVTPLPVFLTVITPTAFLPHVF